MAESGSPRYHFGPLERRGVLLGLRAGQGVALLTGGLLLVICLHTLPGVIAGILGLALLAICAAIAFIPVAGRTA